MEQYIGFGISFLFAAILSVFWVRGIDYMKENHPDYKGEDFLNWGDESAPWETEKKDDKKSDIEGNK